MVFGKDSDDCCGSEEEEEGQSDISKVDVKKLQDSNFGSILLYYVLNIVIKI